MLRVSRKVKAWWKMKDIVELLSNCLEKESRVLENQCKRIGLLALTKMRLIHHKAIIKIWSTLIELKTWIMKTIKWVMTGNIVLEIALVKTTMFSNKIIGIRRTTIMQST
jgi:hypothetical protein